MPNIGGSNLHTGGAATPADVMRATRKPAHVHDARDSEPYRSGNPNAVAGVDLGGARTVLYVPMIRNDDIVGVINLYRQEVRPFTDEQIALLENFASQAVIAIENARLFNETKEALAQQTATSEVLRVISNSVDDTAPVFEKILDSCEKLFATEQLGIFVVQPDGQTHVGAWRGAAVEGVIQALPRLVEQTATGIVIRNRTVLHIPNTATTLNSPSTIQRLSDGIGDVSIAWAPMLTEEGGIGSIAVMRQPPNPFSDKELELLKTFADQAVIAIQNTRLFNETREALARQTATADVLKVIASSPSNLQPVFDAIAERSKALIGGHSTTVFRFAGDMVELVGATSVDAEADAVLRATFPMPVSNMRNIHRILRGEISVTIDAAVDTEPESSRNVARARGWRSRLVVPLKGDNEVIGFISITRKEPGAFADKDIELVRTFADQAVIAIQNVELFEEVQVRTGDLQESLQQQIATADVLKVISRSVFDLQIVLDTLVESAYKLCGASLGLLYLRGGEDFECKAIAGIGVEAATQLFKGRPIRAGRGTAAERVILTGEVHAVTDFFADPEFDPVVRERIRNDSSGSDISQLRSTLAVPMTRDNEVVGVLVIARTQTGPFPQRQTELLQTFADQAVIAIENLRLFNETQEALARQTATADVLKVIASSPSNLQPVFDAIAERSNELIGGHSTTVGRYVDGMVQLASYTPVSPEADAILRAMFPSRPTTGDPQIAQVLRGEIARIAEAETEIQDSAMRETARARGWRSRLLVPLKDDTAVIGWISVTRKEPGEFAEKDVELLRTFADQAVIAISNVELFRQVQARTRDLQESLEQQTATAEILSSISGSMNDTKPVFDAIVRNLLRLFGTRFAVVQTLDQGIVEMPAVDGEPGFERLRERYPRPLAHDTVGGIAMLEKRTLQFHPVLDNPAAPATTQEFARDFGFNSVLFNPMLSGDKVVGAIGVARHDAVPFDDKQIALIASFANQAVIAIENTRLLRELQERTDALTRSLDDLRAAQDRLVQTEKLASLGQLTAGIAHEIKNPLNFVNNFSALSVELTDELNDLLKQAELTEKLQQEVNDLTQLLKSNLEKVVQHGKRADSIVKNMLLHSREGSGEQRAADINALVEESLNLAYHGARAEKSGFNITLHREFDAGAGSAELYPQEITRALLNLISNGFYAASKRKAENGEKAFEPTLLATTKDLGHAVEIRIRDNGTGIPAEVREKMFNPFFTTKPAGEGTGLGLSMTHDIIVKQHGGTIDVATEPGHFTEFILVLPRANGSQGKIKGPA